jgi:hypothetical protein
MDEFERRSRLVSLAYEVLREMKSPSDEATTEVILYDLSRAFFDKAATLPPLEGGPQKGTRKLTTAWPYTVDFRVEGVPIKRKIGTL